MALALGSSNRAQNHMGVYLGPYTTRVRHILSTFGSKTEIPIAVHDGVFPKFPGRVAGSGFTQSLVFVV